ncbi:hypothetical protein UA08_07759 [Talaromyces atroroseus]|uniref:C2H2-type domain-containing protein n=1 Tax=Talaromyces atroroseus TaxID=1441469 RepID=A0A225AMR2_TALAT|nr:hypothetical protein UA08_07759 [Talaromyces atroroseus]OKL56879.1 hypothetical protein UA08_07759 [Talaromyces atroroseus]
MLALESSRQQPFPYFAQDQISLDADVMDSYGFPSMQQQQQLYDPALWMEQPSDLHKQHQQQQHMLFPNSPPSMAASHYSAASGASIASASSSAMGSPYSGAAHTFQESWIDTANGLMGLPGGGAMMPELDFNPMASMDADSTFAAAKFPTVDPTAIHHAMSYAEDPRVSLAHSSGFVSPAPIGSPLPSQNLSSLSQMPVTSSPYLGTNLGHQVRSTSVAASLHERPASIISALSPRSHPSPAASNTDLEDNEGREKRRCPWPDCGRSFKDLKAHMLTHQSERPEKCPIVNCEYHLKGFARKYDKNRHTLTHYKGTMVCGFCPGSGSAAEKSFNRADVFKRHLMSVHGVEQTAPNCRKRSPTSGSSSDQHSSSSSSTNNNSSNQQRQQNSLAGYSEDATGKCSTCSGTFSNAQDFYEHLDDCVLRVVQQEEPSEAINQKRLAEVAGDEDVKLTMEKHKLLDTASPMDRSEQYDEYNDDDNNNDDDDAGADDADEINNNNNRNKAVGSKAAKSNKSRPVLGANSAVGKNSSSSTNKPRPITRRRGNRNSYPQSWGTPVAKMKTKKRVICAYDGPRRLLKDEMMLDNEYEVRIRLASGAGDGTNRAAYVTDLDMMSLKRVDGIFSATEEERGPWMMSDQQQQQQRLMGQPAVLLPEVTQVDDLGIDIDELMAYKENHHRPSADGLCV